MVYIYLPLAYYQINLDVTKDNLLAAGFSAVPAVFLVSITNAWFTLKWRELSRCWFKNNILYADCHILCRHVLDSHCELGKFKLLVKNLTTFYKYHVMQDSI